MSDPQKPAPSPKPELTRIPVARIFFKPGDAFDFPGMQESNISCVSEIAKYARCYVAFFIPAWSHMEVTSATGGEVLRVDMIPMWQIKSWVKA